MEKGIGDTMSEENMKIYIHDLDISNKAKGFLIRVGLIRFDDLLNCDINHLASARDIPDDILSELTGVVERANEIIDSFDERKKRIAELLPSVQNIPISDLELSTRTYNALRRAGIYTTGSLIQMSKKDIYELRGIGKQSVDEIIVTIDSFLGNGYEHTALTGNKPPLPEQILLRPVTDLHLSVRPLNVLRNAGIKTIGQVVSLKPEDISKMKNMGALSARQFWKQIGLLYEKGEDYFKDTEEAKEAEQSSQKYDKREIDITTVNKLLDHYKLKTAWLCEWYGLSRQRIYQKIERRRINHGNWCGKQLLPNERAAITRMINSKFFYCEENGVKYYLVNNMKDDCAFIVVSDDDVKCFFLDDLPEALQARVRIERLHFLTEDECKALENLGHKVFIMKKPYFMPSNTALFRKFASARELSKEEYAKFLFGIPYCSPISSVTDERIIAFLEDNTINGITSIPSIPENHWIRSYISRSPYSTNEFIRFFGFKTEDDNAKAVLDFSSEDFRIVEDDMCIYDAGTDYLDRIFAHSPLLGSRIISQKNLETLNKISRDCIDKMLQNPKFKPNLKAEMQITLSVINYAKEWDSEDESGFWKYITTSFGYHDEGGQLLNILYKCIKDALAKNRRLFITDSVGNHYKSSVMVHSFSTKRSWLYFCDFLFDFYKKNLNWEYIEDDPMIARMVLALRNKLQNTSGAQYEDVEISSKINYFREGIVKLIVNRPKYAAQLVSKILKRIDGLVNHTVQAASCYEEQLCDEWMENKLQMISEAGRKERSAERRTVAIDYTRIKPVYRLVNETEIAIEFPDVRLAENNFSSLTLTVYHDGHIVEQKSLRYYGNELGKSMSGFSLRLEDYLRRSGSSTFDPQLVITCDNKEIYNSESILYRDSLVFRNKNEVDIGSCVSGGYSVFISPKDVIEFTNAEVASVKSNQYIKGFFANLQKDYTIYINGRLAAFDNNGNCGELRLTVPGSRIKAEYIAKGIRYSVISGRESIHIISSSRENEKKYRLAVNADVIPLGGLPCEESAGTVIYQLELDRFGTEELSLQLMDIGANRLLLQRNFVIIRQLSYRYNRPYYFSAEDFREARMKLAVGGDVQELPLTPGDTHISIPYQNGELEIPVPVIKVIDNTNVEWNGTTLCWIKDIPQERFLCVKAPEGIKVDLQMNNRSLAQENQNTFALGNAVIGYSNVNDAEWLDLRLIVLQDGQNEQSYLIGRIAAKEQFVKIPKLKLEGSVLSWDRGFGFIGDKTGDFKLTICSGSELEKTYDLKLDEDIITEDLQLPLGEYPFRICKRSGNIFAMQMVDIATGTLFAGDVNELRFLKHIIQINSITFEDSDRYESVKIRPCYIDHIEYKGIRYCASEERNCPVYSGIMFFIGGNGKRYEYSYEDKIDNKGHQLYQINPVRIIFINDSILSITHDTGDPLEPGYGFYYYKYYDKYAGVTVYQITDWEPAKFNRDKYYLADLYSYSRKKGVCLYV